MGGSELRVVLDRRRPRAGQFTYGSNFSTSYPITIYGPWLRRALCFAVPAAFVAYFPALALLGRPDPVAVAGLVWRSGVRHYQGTGS
jgi:ABC-2 type transport system permease protein